MNAGMHSCNEPEKDNVAEDHAPGHQQDRQNRQTEETWEWNGELEIE